MRLFLSLVLLLATTLCFSQSPTGFFAEAGTGLRTGWWILERGSSTSSQFSDDGIDNGHLSPIWSLETVIGWNFGKTAIGAGADYTRFFDYALRRQAYTGFIFDRSYSIAENSFGQAHLFVQAQHSIISSGKFELAPFGRAGWFHQWAFELDEEELLPSRHRYFGQLGIDLCWYWESGIGFYLRPVMHDAWMQIPDQTLERKARHRMPSFGIHTGIRWRSSTQSKAS